MWSKSAALEGLWVGAVCAVFWLSWKFGLGMLVVSALVYVLMVINGARKTVSHAPRTEMYVCDKHGPMPIGATHTLFDGDNLEQVSPDGRTLCVPVRVCPICFEASVKVAKGER